MRRKRLKLFLAVALSGACAAGLQAQTPNLTSVDVGLPLLEGSTTTSDGKITIVGGGDDIWNNADNFHYAYTTVTGDFDYAVQVEDLQGPDNWSKAELMARQIDPVFGPEGGDPHISNMTTRSGGQNQLAPQFRTTRDGISDWVDPVGTPRPTYPNTWLRIERIGDVFYLYHSTDGQNWSLYEPSGTVDTGGDPIQDIDPWFTEAWPNEIALGLAVTAHNDPDPDGATAVFSNFGPYQGTPIAINTQPQATVSVSQNQPLTLSIDAAGDPVHYQWRKDGADIPGATGATYTVDLANAADAGTYSVRLFASGQEVVSENSVVTVTADTIAPEIVSAMPDESFTSVVVKYSEPVGSSAETASNYSINKGINVSSVSRIDDSTVKLTTSAMAEGGEEYTLTVNNVQDTASPANTIAADSTASFKTFVFQTGAVLHKFWEANSANNLDALRNDPRFPDAPTWVSIEPRFEYPPNGSNEGGSNYGNQLVGWFIPPQTGDYIFFVNADDPADLYLSEDDDPANKHLIAREGGWSNARNWVSAGGGASNVDDKRSDFFFETEWPGTPWTGIPLQGGERYYLEAIHTEGGGGDNVAATYILTSESDPANGDAPRIAGDAVGAYLDPNGASVTINQQPMGITVAENREGTLSVEAEGTSAYGPTVTYQWQEAPAGSSNFTDIAGATSASYTTPLLTAADEGRQYRVLVSVPTLTETSDVATVTISADNTPPSIVSAGALSGDNQIGVRFNEILDEASAETAGNYQVTGATVSSATLQEGNVVVLGLSGAVSGSFTVTVNGVEDAAGNAASGATATGEINSELTSADVGDPGVNPVEEGEAVAIAEDGFYIAGGGNDIWGNADGFHYLYTQFTGPFDVRARVDSLIGGDEWGKAGLMARESLEAGSRNQMVLITKTGTYEGNESAAQTPSRGGVNVYNHQWRDTLDGASASKAGGERISPTVFPSWIRLVRTDTSSNEMTSYISYDGQDWIEYHSYTTPDELLPATLYIGMAVVSHDNAAGHPRAEAVFSNFSLAEYQEITDPNLSISMDGDEIVVTWDTGTLVGAPVVIGPYTPVSGATSPYRITPSEDEMYFQVQQ